jgi:hypothetical protein
LAERLRVKWDLTRRLYETGLQQKDILELYRLIDWLLGLPEELERDFKQQVIRYEQSKVMPYVTSIERLAKEEGRTEGRTEGQMEGRTEGMAEAIVRLLHCRWKSAEPVVEQRIRALPAQRLEALAEALWDFKSPADLEIWLSHV